MDQAGGLEKELHVPEGMRLFKERKPDWGYGLIGPPMAAWVVYVSVFAGWLYIAGARGWWNPKSSEYIASPAYILAGAGAVLLLKWLIPALPQIKRRLEKWPDQKTQKKFTRFLQSEGWDVQEQVELANGCCVDIVGTRHGEQLWVEVKGVIYKLNPAMIRQIAAQFRTPSGMEPGTKIRRALLLPTPPLIISSNALRDFRENQIELWYADSLIRRQ